MVRTYVQVQSGMESTAGNHQSPTSYSTNMGRVDKYWFKFRSWEGVRPDSDSEGTEGTESRGGPMGSPAVAPRLQDIRRMYSNVVRIK